MTVFSAFALILLLGQEPATPPADTRVLASTKNWTITARDFETILGTLSPDARNFYSQPENRRAFLGDIIQMWVMADEAQTKGIDAEPALKAILTFYQRNLVALEYRRRITAATGDSPTVQAQNFQGGVPAAEARRLIEEVKTRLQAGGNFEELAREYSKDPGSADRGGDLGFITRGQFVPEVEDAAFALEVGATSDIVESAYGFHIIRLMDRILMPFSEVQNQIRQKMVADQVMKDIEGRVTAADVQIDEEFFKDSPAQNVR
jgi:hypothetical protein